MRKLLIVGVLGVMVVSLAACGDSGSDAETAALQLKADKYEIEQIEKVFHQAMTTKDIDLMVSLWAPNATLTVGPDRLRPEWTRSESSGSRITAFAPETTWVTDHPAYKMEITVNGDRGTLHFECHFVNYETGEVEAITGTDQDVARVDGRWLITNMVGGIDRTDPLSRVHSTVSETERGCRRREAPADEPWRLSARPDRGSPARQGPHETAHRVRGHRRAARRRRRSRASRPRTIERPGERARAAPGTSRRVRQAPERHLERPQPPRREPPPGIRLLRGVAGARRARATSARRLASPSTRRSRTRSSGSQRRPSPTGWDSCLPPRTRASSVRSARRAIAFPW